MRFVKAILILLALLCAAPQAAHATSPVLGQGGYYWWQGAPYTRYIAYVNGCRVWKYVAVANYQAPAASPYTLPRPNDPAWREKFTDIIGTLAKYEAQAKASALEHNEYLETLEKSGLAKLLEGNYSPRYATGGAYGAYSAQLFQQIQSGFAAQGGVGFAPFAQQGSTVYGVQQANAAYPGVDLAELYRMSHSLAEQGQQFGAQATNDFNAATRAERDGQGRIAEIQARAQAAAFTMQAAGAGVPTPRSTTTTTLNVGPGAAQAGAAAGAAAPSNQPTAATASDRQALAAVVEHKCNSCHGGQGANGAKPFDFATFPDLDEGSQEAVIARLFDKDPNRVMPKTGPLPPEGLIPWLKFYKKQPN